MPDPRSYKKTHGQTVVQKEEPVTETQALSSPRMQGKCVRLCHSKLLVRLTGCQKRFSKCALLLLQMFKKQFTLQQGCDPCTVTLCNKIVALCNNLEMHGRKISKPTVRSISTIDKKTKPKKKH